MYVNAKCPNCGCMFGTNDAKLEFERLYNGENLKKIPVQYKDYAAWAKKNAKGVELARMIQFPIILAYALTIHKSQGSEFELVLMPICMSYYRMLYRKLIYTGVTRAKQKLIIVGERKAFEYAVANTNERIRKTSLKEKIEKMYNF